LGKREYNISFELSFFHTCYNTQLWLGFRKGYTWEVSWSRPPRGSYKMNVDHHFPGGNGAVAVVIRNGRRQAVAGPNVLYSLYTGLQSNYAF
jgi:hypothetical protein